MDIAPEIQKEIFRKYGLPGFIMIIILIVVGGLWIKNYLESQIRQIESKNIDKWESWIRQIESKNIDKWKLKLDACLEILRVADGVMSQRDWNGFTPEQKAKIVKQEVDTIKARDCYNRLACLCNSSKVLDSFKKLLGVKGPISADIIVDLRNAVREELGFGEPIDVDRDNAFICYLEGDKKIQP